MRPHSIRCILLLQIVFGKIRPRVPIQKTHTTRHADLFFLTSSLSRYCTCHLLLLLFLCLKVFGIREVSFIDGISFFFYSVAQRWPPKNFGGEKTAITSTFSFWELWVSWKKPNGSNPSAQTALYSLEAKK